MLSYIESNRSIIIGISICLLVGFVIAIFGYIFMDELVRAGLEGEVRSSFDLSNTSGYEKINIIINGIKSNLLFIFILMLASITIIGIPIIYIMYIVKGVAIGIYTCIIFSIFSFWNAVLCTLMLIIITNIVYLPGIIYIGINLLKFNNRLMEYIKEGKLIQRAILEGIKLFIRIWRNIL